MITPKNLIRHELIGLDVRVVDSTNKSNVGIEGAVVDETKEMLAIKTDHVSKKIAKKTSTFMFTIDHKKVRVDGKRIVGKPENRIKIKVRKW